MLVDQMAIALVNNATANGSKKVAAEIAPTVVKGAAEVIGRDALVKTGQKALGPNAGVTSKMMKAIETMLDPKGTGVITKAQGFVELAEPAGGKGGLFSNYYDEAFQHGPHVKPLPTSKVTELMSQGYTLRIRAVSGEVGYSSTPMSAAEIKRMTADLMAILEQSPLKQMGGMFNMGQTLPVREIVQPHYMFRSATDRVYPRLLDKVESIVEAGLTASETGIKINPAGQHAEGAFLLETYRHPAI